MIKELTSPPRVHDPEHNPNIIYCAIIYVLGGPQESFFLCAVSGTGDCTPRPSKCLTKHNILQILFAGDLWPTQYDISYYDILYYNITYYTIYYTMIQ